MQHDDRHPFSASLPRRVLPAIALAGILATTGNAEEPGGDGAPAETAQDAETLPASSEPAPDSGAAKAVDGTGSDDSEVTESIDELALERNVFERLMAAGEYASAVETGKRLVVLALAESGPASLDYGKALTALATAQQETGDFEAARDNFTAAIRVIEGSTDRLDAELIDPLHALGRTNLEAERPDDAADALERAVHVSQVNAGPQNLGQVELLDDLSEAYYQLGDFKQADALQRYSVGLHQRVYHEDDDSRLVPALYRRAYWLNRMGMFMREQAVYAQIIRIIERADGRRSLDLIPALTALARTFVYSPEKDAKAQGERRLRRAISIARENEEAPVPMYADTEISLGDYYNLLGERTGARRAYKRAWELLDVDDLELAAIRDERFAQPTPLNNQSVRPEETQFSESVAEFNEQYASGTEAGYVSVAYDVSRRGRVRNVRVVESVPAGLRDEEAVRWVKRFVFRPRFEDGAAVETPDQLYRYEFRYRSGDVDRMENSGDGEAPADEQADR